MPARFGYMVITIDGNAATGVFRAFMNYAAATWTMTGSALIFHVPESSKFTNSH